MGFRSTCTSLHYYCELPKWFHDKYGEGFSIDGTLVQTRYERKFYSNDFFEDFQKALTDVDWWKYPELEITLAVLAEDGIITKVIISKDSIKYFQYLEEGIESENCWMQ